MIFRLSQKLAKKLKIRLSGCLPPPSNPFVDWSASLFTVQRAQYIILTNTGSLYSVVMLGRGIADEGRFVNAALDSIREALIANGQDSLYRRFISSMTDKIEFSAALNRSVTGSMNDLILNAKLSIGERGISPFDADVELNRMPMSVLGYGNPRDAFRALEGKPPTSESDNADSVF
jgi:hypothetical protein